MVQSDYSGPPTNYGLVVRPTTDRCIIYYHRVFSVGLASALFEEFGHERKKLEEIRGPVVEDHEEGIKEESGELDRTLQSLLLWTFSQTNKFPGVRHVPRCQKVIKELSIGVSQKP